MLRLVLSILALSTLAGCGSEIGEICEDDADCKSELCMHASAPAAAGRLQCSLSCEGGCPEGTACVNGTCMLACDGAGDEACPEGTACARDLLACFATCTDDSECGNNTCSSRGLCDGEGG